MYNLLYFIVTEITSLEIMNLIYIVNYMTKVKPGKVK
jgi:hypothetical protein